MPRNTVIITGANGWLGRRLIKFLKEESEKSKRTQIIIKCYDRHFDESFPFRNCEGISLFIGDLAKKQVFPELFSNAENSILIHCAGIIHPRCFTREFASNNVVATIELIKASISAEIKRFVYISSSSAFGFSRDRNAVIDEESNYQPYMKYGHSKMLAEKAVKNLTIASHLETVIVRIPWFYGADPSQRMMSFLTMIQKGWAPLIGNGSNLRSMACVDDICKGLWLCATNEKAVNQTYWICDERPYSMKEIIETIERIMKEDFRLDIKSRNIRLPTIVAEIAMLSDKILQAIGLYSEKIHVLSEMSKNIVCSPKKAISELGFIPARSLDAGMKESIKSFIDKKY